MILQELFNTLSTGALANTTFSGTDGLLKETYHSKIINQVNLGVIELYKRFKLLENELTLHVTPNTRRYYLRADRVAPVTDITDELYIEEVLDVDGFLNIIEVLSAYDSNGTEIRMNYTSSVSLYDPDYAPEVPTIKQIAPDILQITDIVSPQIVSIVYQSYPNKIVADDTDPEDYELNIPDTIVDPLLLFIAAKVFKPMGANDSTANADKSSSYEQQYELACQKLMLYGLAVQDTTERDIFKSNGWV
jgi:hypothetical protein